MGLQVRSLSVSGRTRRREGKLRKQNHYIHQKRGARRKGGAGKETEEKKGGSTRIEGGRGGKFFPTKGKEKDSSIRTNPETKKRTADPKYGGNH